MTDDKDHVTDLRVAVAQIQEKLNATDKTIGALERRFDGKAGREWTIIATGLGLMGTIIAKNLGWY